MKKFALALLTFAVAVPLTFAQDTTKDSNGPAKPAKTKKHKKSKKSSTTTPTAPPAK
jgi:hypothetical protein